MERRSIRAGKWGFEKIARGGNFGWGGCGGRRDRKRGGREGRSGKGQYVEGVAVRR